MKIVVTRVADLDPRGIVCRQCGRLLSVFDRDTDTHAPNLEQLLAAGAVAVPNFGWFCGQDCGETYGREHDIAFQRDASGKIAYY
jgi:hypothetical protein